MKKDAEYFGSLQKSRTFAPANETKLPCGAELSQASSIGSTFFERFT